MVHKQEGADKLHNSDMCGIQWDMSPDGHCGATPRYPAEQVPSSWTFQPVYVRLDYKSMLVEASDDKKKKIA